MKENPCLRIWGAEPDFKFSEDERNTIWTIIKKEFGPQKATLLTDWLEIHCQHESPLIRNLRAKAHKNRTHRGMMTGMVRTFRQTAIYLEMLSAQATDEFEKSFSPIVWGMVEKAAREGVEGPKTDSINLSSKHLAQKTLPSLNRLIETLEKALKLQPSKKGTPRRSVSSWIRWIAQDYQEILGKKPKNGGVFLKVIQELLSILKLPSQNPRRAIREALRGLN